MKVKEIMHSGTACVAPDTFVVTLAKKMLNDDIGALPVHENGRLIGIVTDRDIALRAIASGKNASVLTAKEVMTSDVSCCHDTDEVNDAVRLMESKHIRRLPVLDKSDKVVGMLSLGDISTAMPREVTGELMQAVSAHHA
ncbi:CBS domain-containing protein [Inquilinus sp. OTU3971]|uniref:CBS domain-containing protein n=1 Tax=Inquilinus sp. OTU3971 TaxID=3043855 RepID=UPI00313C479B